MWSGVRVGAAFVFLLQIIWPCYHIMPRHPCLEGEATPFDHATPADDLPLDQSLLPAVASPLEEEGVRVEAKATERETEELVGDTVQGNDGSTYASQDAQSQSEHNAVEKGTSDEESESEGIEGVDLSGNEHGKDDILEDISDSDLEMEEEENAQQSK